MLIDELKDIVGPKCWTSDESDLVPHLTEHRGAVQGAALIMVLPAATEEVSKIVAACARAGVAIVPQGGNTGLCAGAIPDASGQQVLLNLSRMNRIRRVDASDFSMVVDAGCILAHVQQAARDVGRIFPLSLAAEGSCQIGGNLSTNAGGVNVIRYGTARSLVLGLEVVLPDGSVWDGLRTLRKDTAGYDMKQLFIGSEGTLGIITAAALRLFPDPGQTSTALIALANTDMAVRLLGELRTRLADRIESFELIGRPGFELVLRHIPGTRLPLSPDHPWYVLVEAATGGDGALLEDALTSCANDGVILDTVIAKNTTESDRLWRMRHSISEAQKVEGPSVKHDISVPIGRLEEFLVRCEATLLERVPAARTVIFGHVGDGNLHYNVYLPGDPADARHAGDAETASELIYDLVAECGGSFSAEHGVGVLKKGYLAKYRHKTELDLMKTVKNALDPENILNPGKIF